MTATADAANKPGKAIRFALWTVQVVLALMFGWTGVLKVSRPMGELAVLLPWSDAVPELLVRFIGLCEVSAALGLVLPSVTRIRPKLTPLAATGLLTLMVLAATFHLTRGEYPAMGVNAVLAAQALFVAWGRHRKAPIRPRS